jgi:hypothetical protein
MYSTDIRRSKHKRPMSFSPKTSFTYGIGRFGLWMAGDAEYWEKNET